MDLQDNNQIDEAVFADIYASVFGDSAGEAEKPAADTASSPAPELQPSPSSASGMKRPRPAPAASADAGQRHRPSSTQDASASRAQQARQSDAVPARTAQRLPHSRTPQADAARDKAHSRAPLAGSVQGKAQRSAATLTGSAQDTPHSRTPQAGNVQDRTHHAAAPHGGTARSKDRRSAAPDAGAGRERLQGHANASGTRPEQVRAPKLPPKKPATPPPALEIEFDSRFNIDHNAEGQSRRDYSYNGSRVSTTQDLHYEPKEAPAYSELRSSYTASDDYERFFGEEGPRQDPVQARKKKPHLPRILPGTKKARASEPEHDLAEFVDTGIYDTPEGSTSDIAAGRIAAAHNASAAAGDDPGVTAEPAADGTPVTDADAVTAADPADQNSKNKKQKKNRKTPSFSVKRLLHADEQPAPDESDDTEPVYPIDRDPESLFSSLQKYLLSRLAGLVLLVRGNVSAGENSATMSTDEEELGKEIRPLAASKYYGNQVFSLRMRVRIAAVLLLFMIYLSLGCPVPGMLQSLKVATAAVLAIQLTVMLLALDVVTNAITGAFRLRFGADFLAVFSCILTSLDAVAVLNSGNVYAHMPLCAISSLSLTGILFSSLLSARALRKSLRVPAIGKTSYTITAEANITAKDKTILKSDRPITGFVRRMEEAPADETMFRKVGPILLAIAFVLSVFTAIIKRSPVNILYIFSAILAPAVPFTALICFALPFFIGSLRIFPSGAALAGWSGVYDLGHSRNIIVTDRDIFPPQSIEIEKVRIFADYDAQKVLTYAGSLILASGCDLAPAFSNLMEENACRVVPIDHLEYMSGGGLRGWTEGHCVVIGSSELMRLLNVHIPYRLTEQTSTLLSIDGMLYGIFNIRYTPDAKVRRALVRLMRSNRHPVFALRDFNLTPDMIRENFDVATDGYDFPPYADRFPISEARPADDSQISAVVCKEGLGPVTDAADTGRSVYVVTMVNLAISLASAVLGMLISFFKLMILGYSTIGGILAIMLLFSVPVILLGCIATSAN